MHLHLSTHISPTKLATSTPLAFSVFALSRARSSALPLRPVMALDLDQSGLSSQALRDALVALWQLTVRVEAIILLSPAQNNSFPPPLFKKTLAPVPKAAAFPRCLATKSRPRLKQSISSLHRLLSPFPSPHAPKPLASTHQSNGD